MKLNNQQIHLISANKRQSFKRLINANIDVYKIASVVKKLSDSFKDYKLILLAWNSQPALFNIHGSIERLIDAKYLAAIHMLYRLETSGLSITENELYYVWLLFFQENKRITPNLFSLKSFFEFKKTWTLLMDNITNGNNFRDESKMNVDKLIQFSEQLKIEYSMNQKTQKNGVY